MADYETLYYKLFHTITDTINTLKSAQAEAEQLFTEMEVSNQEPLTLLTSDEPQESCTQD